MKNNNFNNQDSKESQIEKIINAAVQKGILIGRTQFDTTIKDTYKSTEKRLYAMPTLRLKVENDKKWLHDIKMQGAPERSKSVMRFSTSGVRLTPDEIMGALEQDTLAKIAVDEHEIETIEKALEIIRNDPYITVIRKKYFEGCSDERIAESMHCDTSTVRRNKKRLVQSISIFLYGARVIV